MRTFQVLVLITLVTSITLSQNVEDRIVLSGNLATDSKILFNNYSEPHTPQFSYPAEDKKSPILAGVLSLLIPSAGEIYTEEYLKAGIFIEVITSLAKA